MTEPDCLENTQWIINKDMAMVTETQLTSIRTLKSGSTNPDDIADNFRPVQLLNTRTVNKRVAPWSIGETQAQVIGGTLVGVAVFNAVNELPRQPPARVPGPGLPAVRGPSRPSPVRAGCEDREDHTMLVSKSSNFFLGTLPF